MLLSWLLNSLKAVRVSGSGRPVRQKPEARTIDEKDGRGEGKEAVEGEEKEGRRRREPSAADQAESAKSQQMPRRVGRPTVLVHLPASLALFLALSLRRDTPLREVSLLAS